jgi:hypothetical protein
LHGLSTEVWVDADFTKLRGRVARASRRSSLAQYRALALQRATDRETLARTKAKVVLCCAD